jgi:hypothetical protein
MHDMSINKYDRSICVKEILGLTPFQRGLSLLKKQQFQGLEAPRRTL